MPPPRRRFPPPWKAVRTPGGYAVVDATGGVLAYLYGRDDGGVGYNGLTLDEARRIAVGMARLPVLMKETRVTGR